MLPTCSTSPGIATHMGHVVGVLLAMFRVTHVFITISFNCYLHMSVTVLSNHVSPLHERLLQAFEASFPEPDTPSHINSHDAALIPLSQQSICVRNSRYPRSIWRERLCTERRAQRKIRNHAEQAGDSLMGIRLPHPPLPPQEMCSLSRGELHLFFPMQGCFLSALTHLTAQTILRYEQ